jgi:hypothetical protein
MKTAGRLVLMVILIIFGITAVFFKDFSRIFKDAEIAAYYEKDRSRSVKLGYRGLVWIQVPAFESLSSFFIERVGEGSAGYSEKNTLLYSFLLSAGTKCVYYAVYHLWWFVFFLIWLIKAAERKKRKDREIIYRYVLAGKVTVFFSVLFLFAVFLVPFFSAVCFTVPNVFFLLGFYLFWGYKGPSALKN